MKKLSNSTHDWQQQMHHKHHVCINCL